MINIKNIVGSFAENKDLARDIRINKIEKQIKKDKNITLDFKGVEATTQSFIHALISQLIRDYGNSVLDKIYFKNCNEKIKKIINIVVDYMQESEN